MFWKHSLSFISDTIKDWKFLRNLKESLKKKIEFSIFSWPVLYSKLFVELYNIIGKASTKLSIKSKNAHRINLHSQLLSFKAWHYLHFNLQFLFFFGGGGNLILIIINQSKWRKYTACLKHPHENYLYYIYLTPVV